MMTSAGEPRVPPLRRLAELLSRHFIVLACALMIAGVHLTIFYRPDLQQMEGDHSIQIYLAQRALDGSPPYVAGLYAKTPATPLLTAGAIAVGRLLSLSDIMSGRLLFVALGGLGVLALCLAGAGIFVGRTWRAGDGGAAAGGLIAGATLLAFSLLSISAAMGMEPKLILIVFGYLAVWLTARRRWGWAGACATMAFLAWQPAGLFPVAVALAAVCQSGEARPKALGRVLLGALIPSAVVGVYLMATGALGPAWRQAGLGALSIGQVVVGKGSLLSSFGGNLGRIYGRLSETYLGMARPVFLTGLAGWIGLAVVEPLRAMLQERDGGRRLRRLWEAVRRPAQLPIMVVGAGFLTFSAIDFQSGPDFLPLLPLAGLGIGWWWLFLSDYLMPRRWLSVRICGGLVVCAALAGFGMIQLVKSPAQPAALQAQVKAAAALYELVGDETDVQFFGCLAPLVIYRRQNVMPYVMLKTKHLNLMARELGDISDLAALVEQNQTPALVLAGVSAGNERLATLLAASYRRVSVSLGVCMDREASTILIRKVPGR